MVTGCGIAGKVVERLTVVTHTKGGRSAGVGKDIPPEVNATVLKLACNSLPVGLGVVNAGNGQIGGGTGGRPARLGDPDGFAFSNGSNLVIRLEEEVASIADRVLIGSLIVRILVQTQEVAVGDDLGVCTIDIDVPGVNVADRLAGERCALNYVPDLADVADKDVGSLTHATVGCNTNGRDSV